mgnify:FL=1
MLKVKKNFFQLIILIFTFIMIMTISCNATYDPLEDPNSFKPGNISSEDANVITGRVNSIIGVIVTVGVIISAITLCILGIKYMVGSVEERAEHKKTMIPYIIGAVLLFAASSVVGIIANIVQNMNM